MVIMVMDSWGLICMGVDGEKNFTYRGKKQIAPTDTKNEQNNN